MAFVQFSQVSLAFGDRDILKNVSVNIQAGTKAALTGANGAGKSTLIKVMAGLVTPDGGSRVAQKDARIAYLPQSGLTHRGCTLREEADKAFAFGYELTAELERIGDQLAAKAANTKTLLARHDEILTELEASGWNRRRATAEQVLTGLGFSHADLERRTETFSGGWQMRIALAKSLMVNPDILLLDEPTNYLDIEARAWLERFLNDFRGGFLLVSHDRYFLDHTIQVVYELFNGELRKYPGTFTRYEQTRAAELATLIAQYEQQQAEIAKLEDFIRRFGAKATKAAQAQERQKMLDRLRQNEIVIPESLKKIRISFPQAPHAGNIVLTLTGITKSYGGEPVLRDLSLLVENGDRLVVAGHNGAGKSTLLRIIAGVDRDFSGELVSGAGVSVGYFSQDSAEELRGSQSILELLESESPLELIPRLRDMLGAFLFRGDDVFKPIDVLSGGEKSRVALLRLLLRPVNLLVLDEPTNHLDMHSKDVLLDALASFGGTVIFVSHDRGFIEGLATRVLELRPGRFRTFPGDYAYYMRRLEDEANGIVPADTDAAATAETKPSSNKQRWEAQKKAEAERRKTERAVQALEAQIAEAEANLKTAHNALANPAVYTDGEKAKTTQQEIDRLTARLDDLNAQWEAAAEQLERLSP
ncbi:MAG: ABC-F family ATP-binding cassette domain-containing protein [Treponema sp.]|nr:ABC-F family ATP-binding cassette domain-containing protein [Treponema sp.]